MARAPGRPLLPAPPGLSPLRSEPRFERAGIRGPRTSLPVPAPEPAQLLEEAVGRTHARSRSSNPNQAAARLDQLGGIVADTALEYDRHIANLGRPRDRISLDDDEVRQLALGDAAESLLLAQNGGPVECH